MAHEPDTGQRRQARLDQLDVLEAHYFARIPEGRHKGRSRHNPLFVWAAIRICCSDLPELPLPGWVTFYLGSVASRLIEVAEGIDREHMPHLDVADDAPVETILKEAKKFVPGRWLTERRLAEADAGEAAMKILGLRGRAGQNPFREYAATLRKQAEAIEARERRAHFQALRKQGKVSEADDGSVAKRLRRAKVALELGEIEPLPNGPEATRRARAKARYPDGHR